MTIINIFSIDVNSQEPIFMQIATSLEDGIFTGIYAEETQIPSTTEISTVLKINPATVLKGMNILADDDLIYKKRGVGMFVSQGAVSKIRYKRQELFFKNYIETLVSEAKKLDLNKNDIMDLIERGFSYNEDRNQ